MIAAFLLVVSCAVAPVQAGAMPKDECQTFETQSWEAPTEAELADCADLAEQLRSLGKQATCEVVPMADSELEYKKLDVDIRPNNTYWRFPDHRTKYGGNLIQREFDQNNYVF